MQQEPDRIQSGSRIQAGIQIHVLLSIPHPAKRRNLLHLF